MPLQAGSRLGPYQIVAPIGAGGMGEVCRAVDTRLGREVAIKVLPAEVSADAARLSRFENEARAASALNHPNIVTIYEIGRADGLSYIAMELVDGKTLRELLVSGALPTRKLLQIVAQAASGLAKAHAAGIVHRDLKPENLMATGDGVVKILDFGLAKLMQPAALAEEDAEATTQTHVTRPGAILGTVGYMSPEQASGRELDFRSDQFSFGVILYELATGKRAFQRDTAAQTLAAIIQDEPTPIAALNPKAPASCRWIVERCLSKDPEERYASTLDLARDLAGARDRLSGVESTPESLPVRDRFRWRRRVPAGIAATVLLALGIAGWWLRQRDYFWKNPLEGAHFLRLTDWEGSETDAAISPDGKFVSFLADRDEGRDLWVGQIGGSEFLNLTKGRYPELEAPYIQKTGFTADGAYVWFSTPKRGGQAQGMLFVPTIGGAPRPLLSGAVEAAWSSDGRRVAYHTADPGDPLFIADRSGGDPRQVFGDKPGMHIHFPAWSPDGRFVYFVRGAPPNDMDVWRIPASGGEPERLTFHRSNVAYPTLLDDHSLLYRAPRENGSGYGLFAMDVDRRIPHPVSLGLEEYMSVAASADGRRLVATVANPVRSLWSVPVSDHVVGESAVTRFPLPTVRAGAPRLGPDYLVYLSSKGGPDGLWRYRDGSEWELWRGADGPVIAAPAVSSDGGRIAFVVEREEQGRLHVVASDGTNAHPIAGTLDVRDAPSWSPDGKWIAVAVREGQAMALYKVPTDGGPPVRLVEGMISDPVWSPDGSIIVYSEGQGGAVVRLHATGSDGRPVPMPEVQVVYTHNRYRFLPDGKGLVVLQGPFARQNFSLLDLATGRLRPLTDLRPLFRIESFDVFPDGKRILFDRFRENSDIVLIDLPRRH
jgi:serine/threonine protein kinase/Tol biopolymer transport system component